MNGYLSLQPTFEYFFSIHDTCETITFMETAPPNTVLLCVPSFSVTNSQNVLPISAEPSFSTLGTLIPSDSPPEKNYCLQSFEYQSITGNT
jgi:hypothetical protein